jgi:hypothetical protein
MRILITLSAILVSLPVFSKENNNGVNWNKCVNKYCISKSKETNQKLGLEVTVFNSINNQSFWLVNNGSKKLCFFKQNTHVESKLVSVDYCLKINSLFAFSK